MASTVTPTQCSEASSPVRFDSPPPPVATPSLRPAPLRIPERKPRMSIGDDEDAVAAVDGPGQGRDASRSRNPSDGTTRRRHFTPPKPRFAVTDVSSQRRPTALKLGKLVSKFEILDAVNNANADSSRIPRPSQSHVFVRTGFHRPPDVSQRAKQQSTSSGEKSSTADDSLNLTPRQMPAPRVPERRSMLPVGTCLRTATTDDSSGSNAETRSNAWTASSDVSPRTQTPRGRNAKMDNGRDTFLVGSNASPVSKQLG
ncbi:uncharacterized protein BCR38DRAFT_490679 [Pseudomassariella vexata]|uniref:Uncharacterized protein n=1 Tax=Pseudomassariella vexata TaxID=1141098 RepID=A0A1Y2DAT6_9PEZI|nr:uncharacterized protein BCR38DRAFT_490679 [Pseudomassariella vexata]ORY56382.1 hypothetical protein BCR38DRAFT_490679 [Pseudomassariella vexata]